MFSPTLSCEYTVTATGQCLTEESYHILGSTLTCAGLAVNIGSHVLELLPVLRRVQASNYLCCPPSILQIILAASQLANEVEEIDKVTASARALVLIQQALSFEIRAWAEEVQSGPSIEDLASREHVASAHRSAVCLYILQAIPPARQYSPVTADTLVGEIFNRLSMIGEMDPYFKATSWPTFIAGAETRDPAQRASALQRLLSVWAICPWGYIFAAIELLQTTWKLQDEAGLGDAADQGWLQQLWALNSDCLIV